MHSLIRTVARDILPRRFHAALVSKRWWAYNELFLREQGITPIVERFVAKHGTTVLHGPFEGMNYPRECALRRYSTVVLLGSYEMELHKWFYPLCPGKYEQIVDVGASEGYYAVGMALRSKTPVVAYDTAAISRRYCREMAALNGVEKLVTIKSWCDESALKRLHNRRCFIVSDCEGYEVELFSESVIRSLAVSDLVIELHEDSIQSGGLNVRDILSRRLAASHSVQLVNVEARDVSQFPEVSFLGNDAYKAICELGRGSDQQWLVAISKRV